MWDPKWDRLNSQHALLLSSLIARRQQQATTHHQFTNFPHLFIDSISSHNIPSCDKCHVTAPM